MARSNGRWAPGAQIPDWMIDKVVLPLAQRGYISYGQLGIDPHADRMSQVFAIHKMLADEASVAGGVHGGAKQGLSALGKAAQKMFTGGEWRDQSFGDNPAASSNLRGNDSAYLQIVHALQNFHRDQGIGQQNIGDVIASGTKVGARTIAALNPQTPMTDVQVLNAQHQKVLDRQQLTVTADPQVAANLNQIRHWFPQIPATVATSAAFDGYTVNDKFTQDLWRTSMNDKANPVWQRNPDLLAKARAGEPIAYGDVNPQQQKEMEDQAKQGLHPVTGNAVVGSGLLQDIPGVGGALSDAANAAYSGIKGAFRWADAGLSAPLQLETGGLRNAISGKNILANPLDPQSAQSSAGIALGQLLHGDNVDMGSGFFAQGQVAQQQAANSRAALSVNGHAWTIGRGLADTANDALSPVGIHVLQPGSVGYGLASGAADFANAYYADPANAALSAVHDAHAGAQVISAVESAPGIEHSGAINALRRTFNPMTASQFAASPKGRVFSDWAAGETNFDKIHSVVKDAPTAVRLKDAQSVEDVNAIMADAYKGTIRNRVYAPPTAPGMKPVLHPFETIGYGFRNALDMNHVRALGMKPGYVLDVHDPEQAVRNTQRALDNASTAFHNVDHTVDYLGTRMPATEAMARASQDGAPAMLNVAKSMMSNIGDELVRRGFSQAEANQMTRLFTMDQERGWLTAENAMHADAPHLALNGRGESLGGPKYPIDLLNSAIPLPDARAIKRATSLYSSPLGRKLNMQQPGGIIGVADKVNNGMRSLHVLRPALTLRTVAQAQLMSALGGYATMGKHPLEYLGYVMGNPTRPRDDEMGIFQHLMSKVDPQLAGGVNEEDFATEAFRNALAAHDPNQFEQAMSGNIINVLDKAGPSRRVAGMERVQRVAEQGDEVNPDFAKTWASNLARYAQDPIIRYHETHGPEATKAWLNSDAGKPYRDRLAGALDVKPGESTSRPLGFSFQNPEDVNAYVDSIEPDMAWLTGNDPDIRHALGGSRARVRAGEKSPIAGEIAAGDAAEGKTTAHLLDEQGNPVPILNWNTKGVGTPTVLNPQARAILQAKAERDIGPDQLWDRATKLDDQTKSRWNSAYDFLWSRLADQPINRLVKSPDFSQAYWQRMIELVPHADPAEAEKILERARELNAPKRFLKPLTKAVGDAGSTENALTWNQLDQHAKDFAASEVKRVSYEFANKSQLFDSLRLLFPFGDAFRNIAGQALRLGIQNPRSIRRMDQAITQLRQPSLIGDSASPTGGFLYSDPTSGQEVFNYPGSQGFNKLITGVDVPLVGQANSLNIAGQGLPGVGFMGAIPVQFARQMMSDGMANFFDRSTFGSVYRDWVTKNGEVPGNDPASMLLNAVLPPWANRFREAVNSLDFQRQHLYSIGNVERYLVSTGQYSTPGGAITSDQMKRLRTDAGRAATELSLIRAVGAAGLPAAPGVQWEMIDKDGKLVQTASLANQLRNLYAQEKAGKIDNADTEFYRQHGPNVFGQMASLSTAMSRGLPVTKKQAEWVRNNFGIKQDYPAIYGLFAPTDVKGKFDPQLYQQQVNDGERIPTDPNVRMQLANNNNAQQILDNLTSDVRKAGGGKINSKAASLLAQRRRELMVEFPGFGHDFSMPQKADPLEIQTQLRTAAVDPRLRNSQAAQGLRAYYDERDAIAFAYDQQHGGAGSNWSPLTTADGWKQAGGKWQGVRLQLGADQKALAKQYPAVAPIFDLVFRSDTQP